MHGDGGNVYFKKKNKYFYNFKYLLRYKYSRRIDYFFVKATKLHLLNVLFFTLY